MNPRVSIVLPVYNAEKYIDLAIESIVCQTFTNFELLIAQNGSTDRSTEIISKWATRDPRIIVDEIRVNQGYMHALNRGFAAAKGDYVARMDGDDIALPERIEKQLQFLDQHPDHVAVGCCLVCIDEDGDTYCDQTLPLTDSEITESLMSGRCGISHPASMFRSEALRQTGHYRTEVYGAEDQDLWLRLGEVGKLANLPDPLLKYRVHPNNVSFVNESKSREALQRVLEEAFERRNLPPPEQTPRGSDKPMTRYHRRLAWAWSALHAGNQRTARKHARRLVISHVANRSTWVFLLYAYLGAHVESIRRILKRKRASSSASE